MFEMNMAVDAKNDSELQIQKNTIERSFSTLEYCMTQDTRVNYHAITYARNAIRYYEKFGRDDKSKYYIENAIKQLDDILTSKGYIYRATQKELKNLLKDLNEVKSIF